ncbi:pectate lyase [Bacteroidota bacterium]
MKTFIPSLTIILMSFQISAQSNKLESEAQQAMFRATRYMVENVSTNGGYLWYYLPDFSRQWGEMEAYKTMIWLQNPGTVSMGHVFIDAYHSTGNEYYYQAAEKAAGAIIWGQSHEGGWNYMIDFAGVGSLKQWYNTIGKNGWRLEEFQHYYGNCTFDDDVTSDAARFLLRIYLEKLDPKYKPALDKAIDFILKSQYPLGGWPQRYPLKYDFGKNGHPDYSSYYTFNDDVIWENIHFLIQCYLSLGEERLLDPISRGMNFYLISQHGGGGWGQQYDADLKPAGARSYEPKALLPGASFKNAMLLLKFYEFTAETKYLVHVPHAIEWLELTRLPESNSQNGKYTHPTFVEPVANNPIYVHRKGSNVKYGYYYHDYKDDKLLSHYGGKTNLPLEQLINKYDSLRSLSVEEAAKNGYTPEIFDDLNRDSYENVPGKSQVEEIINSLDSQNRWLTKHGMCSNPYIGDGQKQEATDEFASTHVGDETDTSPYRDPTDQEYISTGRYILNMKLLINYLEREK